MHHKGTITIETNRLILRKFVIEDVPAAFTNWTSDEKVTTFLRWPTHQNLSVTKQVLEHWIANYHMPHFYQWAIVLKDTKDVIGTISVVDMNEKTKTIHIGYCIGSAWWHLGYTSEALQAILPFFFEQVQANRIESMHDPKNPNSGKVLKKCGLRLEGILRQADWNNTGIVDACMYSILASEYFQKIEHRKN